MGKIISIYVDQRDLETLEQIADREHRSVEDLASAAVEQAARDARIHLPPRTEPELPIDD